ncbi:MAG: 4Fe-4S binding protein [Deltaproteobacteria bacterium]|nr:4Fe-4S binding protein [Deltaproteobacteria bacterium]
MPQPEKQIFFDEDLCLGCHACEVACKAEHNLPPGVSRARILTDGPALVNEKLELKYRRVACRHCADAPCVKACPTDALHQKADGIVYVEEGLCSGCRSCAAVCPADAIDFHPETYVAQLCDLCLHRLKKGELPFCLKHCMGAALFFGTEQEFKDYRRTYKAQGVGHD